MTDQRVAKKQRTAEASTSTEVSFPKDTPLYAFTRANVGYHEELMHSGFFAINPSLEALLTHLGADGLHRLWVSCMDDHMYETTGSLTGTSLQPNVDFWHLKDLPPGAAGGYVAEYEMPGGRRGLYVGTSGCLKRRDQQHSASELGTATALYEMVKDARLVTRVRTTSVIVGTIRTQLAALSDGAATRFFAPKRAPQLAEMARRAFEVLEIAHY